LILSWVAGESGKKGEKRGAFSPMSKKRKGHWKYGDGAGGKAGLLKKGT